MELNNITNTGTWGQQVTKLNDNFNKVALGIDTLQSAYQSLSQSAIEAVDTLPQTGEANKIYRLVGTTSYSDYMYNTDDLTTPILMATYNNAIDNTPTANSANLVTSGGVAEELALGAVYDVSAKNPTAGSNNDGKWESISALLSDANLNTLIPISVRKGGMSVKFVLSSDNKYVQYRLMAQSFTTDTTKWQGVDDEPTAGSPNLVKSGGMAQTLGIFAENKNANANAIVLTSDNVKEGEVVYYKLSYAGYQSAIGIYNSNDERLFITKQVSSSSSEQVAEGEFTIPSDFAYCKVQWGGVLINYLYSETYKNILAKKIKDLYEVFNYSTDCFAMKRGVISVEGNVYTFASGYLTIIKSGSIIYQYIIPTTSVTVPSGTGCIVCDSTNNTIVYRTIPNLKKTDFILFYIDGDNGLCAGLLYDYYTNKLTAAVFKDMLVSYRGNMQITRYSNKTSVSLTSAMLQIYDVLGTGQFYNNTIPAFTSDVFNYGSSKALVLDVKTNQISIVNGINDIISPRVCLLYFDGVIGFCGGVLFEEYQKRNNKGKYAVYRGTITEDRQAGTISFSSAYLNILGGLGLEYQAVISSTTRSVDYSSTFAVCLNIVDNSIDIVTIPNLHTNCGRYYQLLYYDGALHKFVGGLLFSQFINDKKNVGLPILTDIAHGGTTLYPQNNTRLNSIYAKQGYINVEFDVNKCLDGFICSHDSDICKEALDANGNIIPEGTVLTYEKTVAELQTYKTGVIYDNVSAGIVTGWENLTFNTLEQMLQSCKALGLNPWIEIKRAHTATKESVDAIVGVVKGFGLWNRTHYLVWDGGINTVEYLLQNGVTRFTYTQATVDNNLVDAVVSLLSTYNIDVKDENTSIYIGMSIVFANTNEGKAVIDYAHSKGLLTYLYTVEPSNLTSVETSFINGIDAYIENSAIVSDYIKSKY